MSVFSPSFVFVFPYFVVLFLWFSLFFLYSFFSFLFFLVLSTLCLSFLPFPLNTTLSFYLFYSTLFPFVSLHCPSSVFLLSVFLVLVTFSSTHTVLYSSISSKFIALCPLFYSLSFSVVCTFIFFLSFVSPSLHHHFSRLILCILLYDFHLFSPFSSFSVATLLFMPLFHPSFLSIQHTFWASLQHFA